VLKFATAYVRLQKSSGIIVINIICSKTYWLSPLHQESGIPLAILLNIPHATQVKQSTLLHKPSGQLIYIRAEC
jgi:hypothetical protein